MSKCRLRFTRKTSISKLLKL